MLQQARLKTFRSLSSLDQFILSRWLYSVGDPLISNAEYTILFNTVKKEYPDSEYVHRSWSSDPCPVDLLKRLGWTDMIYKVVLTDKTESIPSLGSMLEIRKELSSAGPGTVSMKHDGWNIQANYYNGSMVNVHTRGRSYDAMDVSALKKYLPSQIPATGSIKVVLELTVSRQNFVKCKNLYGCVSPRSAVHTLLAHPESYDLLDASAFDIHGYTMDKQNKFDVLESWGFNTPYSIKVTNFDEMIGAVHVLSDMEPEYPHPTDGAVYDGTLRRAMRILAWEEPIYLSYVEDYMEQYGPYRISPSILIYPILRKGTTQRQISMTNWQRIIDYNLAPGAPIAFRVASSATADFDEDMTKLLHEQWKDNWTEYQEQVRATEEENRIKWNSYLSLQSILQ